MKDETVAYTRSGHGREFAWQSDHAYVKISAEDSGGRFSLIEDNLTTVFHLPRHLHRRHAEAFYVVSGKVEFQLADRALLLTGGDSLYVPPGTPHEVRCLEPAKMLTLFQPGGIEKLFEAYTAMTEAEMADPEKLNAVNLAHDTVML
jgi:quercetin dioxygenase-like cupin family protein